MNESPYLLELPAVVSFSGGRTSGYMLHHVLDAHDGQPDDLQISFQNTALEHPKTYEFISQVEDEWGVNIVWLEYVVDMDEKETFRVVDRNSYLRDGEPFEAMIRKKNYLPNPVARICTGNLKVKTMERYLATLPAFEEGYTHAIGLRHDEPRRVHRVKGERGLQEIVCPLFDDGVDKSKVLDWWSKQSFDLDLPHPAAGNCVGCMLKGRRQTEELMTVMPEQFDWWVRAEKIPLMSRPEGGTFRSDRPSYGRMRELLNEQGWLFDLSGPDDETIPCMCTD